MLPAAGVPVVEGTHHPSPWAITGIKTGLTNRPHSGRSFSTRPDLSGDAALGMERDFVIVGGGIAGLRAAIALAPAGRVTVLTKSDASESNTGYAQGGIAAAVGEDDRPDLHAADTIRAGDGLCDEQA